MEKEILVAGGTGDLGGRIVKALLKKNAQVKAIVRSGSNPATIDILRNSGVMIIEVDMNDATVLKDACNGVSCVVSALAGLRDVIVDNQGLILDAAVAAGVPRFIPSDYCTDYTQLAEGSNRNFDLRREFAKKLDQTMITPTSIFNGAFAELLTYNIPFLNHRDQTISYWEKPDWKVDFTSMNDVATFTAKAALEDTAPRYLRIASFQPSARELANATGYKLQDKGTLTDLDRYNRKERATHPEGENELYAKWQQSMYMHSMFSARNDVTDNTRYPDIVWSTIDTYIKPVSHEKA